MLSYGPVVFAVLGLVTYLVANMTLDTARSRVIVSLVPVFLLGLLALVIDAACAFRAEEKPSLISCRMAAKVMAGLAFSDVVFYWEISIKQKGYDKDGDNDANGGNDDEREIRKSRSDNWLGKMSICGQGPVGCVPAHHTPLPAPPGSVVEISIDEVYGSLGQSIVMGTECEEWEHAAYMMRSLARVARSD
ncbi:hypothetical protein Tco_1244120 [Tanacetum coccineum]